MVIDLDDINTNYTFFKQGFEYYMIDELDVCYANGTNMVLFTSVKVDIFEMTVDEEFILSEYEMGHLTSISEMELPDNVYDIFCKYVRRQYLY